MLTFEEEWLGGDEAGSSGIDALLGTGMDERRLHLRAHDRWMAARRAAGGCPTLAALLGDRADDFAPHCLILDFGPDGDAPALRQAGHRLRSAFGSVTAGRALLDRLVAHYGLIVESQTPVGFEAELANGRGGSTLYRGILMPVLGESGAITTLYGVITSKDVADNDATITLALEVDAALRDGEAFDAEALWAPSGPSGDARACLFT